MYDAAVTLKYGQSNWNWYKRVQLSEYSYLTEFGIYLFLQCPRKSQSYSFRNALLIGWPDSLTDYTTIKNNNNKKTNTFYNCIVPVRFLPWENRVAFPRGKPAATESRYTPDCAYWVFQCFHNPPNSDMDYSIFNVHTDVNACDCTRVCADTARESKLKVDCGRKIPLRTEESNLRQRHAGLML